MKRILPLVVVSILVLGGLGAVAVPDEDIESLNVEEDLELVLEIKGGLLGYTVTVTNVGNESVSGNLSMNLSTNAWIMILGRELEMPPEHFNIAKGESEQFKMGPVIGIGPAKPFVEGVFLIDGLDYDFNAQYMKGFAFLIYILCSFEIDIPQ